MDVMRVALVVKASNSTVHREDRNMGYWSYPVPDFEWKHFMFGGRRAYANEMNDYDFIFQEDSGPRYLKGCNRPIVYLAIDSTLSDDHLKSRLERAQQADLILVDMDDLSRFQHLGAPVRRLNYCVNDRVFKDYGEEKTIDVSFHCAGNGTDSERYKVRQMLGTYCKKRGLKYTSGILPLPEYARAMAKSKIVVNWPRTPANRPHRVFDAMACGACLVSGPLPEVDGDERVPNRDYVEVEKVREIPDVIDYLLSSGDWREFGQWGQRLIKKYHTWSNRSKQLRNILQDEGIINRA